MESGRASPDRTASGYPEADAALGRDETRSGEPNRDDQEIVALVQGRKYREAVALCARSHGTTIGRFCMALIGSQAEAEELAQETLLAAHETFDSYRGEASVKAWLLGIARRKCARHLERRVRGAAKLGLLENAGKPTASEELVLRRERAQLARSALSGMRPSEREALLLRYACGLPFREVGAACGIDEVAARKRVSRAIVTLRTVLAERE